ncbi:MAG TPA: Nif3-like dinuclear metal center hexameric protein [Candidatus Brocadiia bacterium]|nr:Nif3-like dinuclear metal center hexameric protein [Candidatus Brocadiia bacterium]
MPPILAREIADYVFEIAPNPPGRTENTWHYGGPDVPVTGVAVAWWITPEIFQDMPTHGLNFALSHETVTFSLPGQCLWGTLPESVWDIQTNRNIRDLVERHNMAAHQFHSNVDLAPWGMPRALVAQLGWDALPADWSRGVPVITLPPRPLAQLVHEIKLKLDLPFVRWDGEPERVVSRVAVAWGGLCQSWAAAMCAAPLGFDTLLGGDIIDGVVRLARGQGWTVIDAMHHTTEMDAMRILAGKLRQRFPNLPIRFYPNTSPWRVS